LQLYKFTAGPTQSSVLSNLISQFLQQQQNYLSPFYYKLRSHHFD